MEVSKYIKKIRAEFKAANIKDRKFIKALENTIVSNHLGSKVNCVESYGEPEQILESYIQTMDPPTNSRQKYRIVLIIVCSLILIALMYNKNINKGKEAYISREISNFEGE